MRLNIFALLTIPPRVVPYAAVTPQGVEDDPCVKGCVWTNANDSPLSEVDSAETFHVYCAYKRM
eukprot:10925326-Karenia_brevis.AAC.1